ncbi:galectin-related protein precursor, partial [Biomphalaria glabrata]
MMLKVCFVWLAIRALVADNSCTVDTNCSASMVLVNDVILRGCEYSTGRSSPPMATLALNCLNTINCAAVVCDPTRTSCFQCISQNINGIGFQSTWTGVYLKRRLLYSDLSYNPVTNVTSNQMYSIPYGLNPGDV